MTIDAIGPSNYTDVQGLNTLRTQARAQDPEALRSTAKQFETIFTKMMLQSMRDARLGEDIFGSSAGDMYQSMFDDQIALEMSRGQGIGIAEMLLEQLKRSSSPTPAPTSTPTLTPLTTAATSQTVDPTAFNTNSAKPGSREAFIESILPAASQAAETLGVSTKAVLAQAALETGWGRSVPRAADGRSSHNLFGIKANERWSGPRVEQLTTEFVNGTPQRQVESFRAYSSPAESIADHARLLARSPRYAAVRDTGDNIAAYGAALQQGGYATDPQYAKKLEAVAQTVDRLLAGRNT
jgi:peptidoglycan hydrolase FlgJ